MAATANATRNLLASDFAVCIRDFQDLMTNYAAEHLVQQIFERGPDRFDKIGDMACAALMKVKGGAAFDQLERQLKTDRVWVGLRAATSSLRQIEKPKVHYL